MADEQVPQVGDWVRVWGQVKNVDPHPEEYSVEFESHNEQYRALVRRDLTVFKPDKLPPGARRCTSLWHADDEGQTYVRCERHEGHGASHGVEAGSTVHIWDDEDSDGYIEEN